MSVEYNNRTNERLTTRYSRLPNSSGISLSNADMDGGGAKNKWSYGLGFASPLGNMPSPYKNKMLTDYSQYTMTDEVYNLPIDNKTGKYIAADFNAVGTPEDAKLSQAPPSKNGR